MNHQYQFSILSESVICPFDNPNNGSGPMWCYGSSTIIRDGNRAFATVPEVGQDVPPLCNTRWQLLCREDGGEWARVNVNTDFNEREPCPLVRLPGGRIVLSTNPAVSLRHRSQDGREAWNCEPKLLEFPAGSPQDFPNVVLPAWDKAYPFTEHSYRGIGAECQTGEILLLNILEYGGQAWSLRDASGQWIRQGFLRFPLRGCYPQVALKGRAAYVMAVSDIVEPNPEWRAHKRQVTGQDWDYDFRQLYFSYTPDVTTQDFSAVLTVASRDETAGYIRNEDLWVGPDGDAHFIYIDKSVWYPFMRDQFFLGTPISLALKYCRIHEGKVVERRILAECEEEMAAGPPVAAKVADRARLAEFRSKQPQPGWARFHSTADDRLFVIYHQTGPGGKSDLETGNYVLQVVPKTGEAPVKLSLQHPLTCFFTANVRTGTPPSDTIDLFGLEPEPNTIRYAQVRISRGTE
jgi:hypothetical protein